MSFHQMQVTLLVWKLISKEIVHSEFESCFWKLISKDLIIITLGQIYI